MATFPGSPRPPLIRFGTFVSHSGLVLAYKIDCDGLDDATIAGIAQVMIDRLPPFGKVVGIPTGGLRLAAAIRRWQLGPHSAPTLLVDDVLTTGTSMEEARKEHPGAIGAVIFARGPTAEWIHPLFLEA